MALLKAIGIAQTGGHAKMIVDEGDPYSALLINKSVNKLKSRGIFGKVEQTITEGSTPDLKVLQITVEEKATGEISAGAGAGTDGGTFFISVKENNYLGKGLAIDANASPLKPLVTILLRSSGTESLLVACLLIANFNSSLGIPCPLSMTDILSKPPFSISILIWLLPESIEFSTSSLTTWAGLSTTSPAAIWLAT